MTPACIPPEILALCRALRHAGHAAYLVGGAVRDHLRFPGGCPSPGGRLCQKVAKDFDLTTSASPTEVLRLFSAERTITTGMAHGTVVVLVPRAGMDLPERVEITTFRAEGSYSDGRRPDTVSFIDNLQEDLRRRDFTINAMAYDPVDDVLVDPFLGRAALAARSICAVGDAAKRFTEDGLRPLRAVRLAAQLDFRLAPATEAAIPDALPTVRKVSPERIRDELLKLLGSASAGRGLRLLRRTGLLTVVLPELVVEDWEFEMVVAAVDALPPCEPLLRLAALWAGRALSLAGASTLFGPADWQAALQRLRISNKDQARLRQLLSTALPAYDNAWTDADVRRYLAVTPEGLRADQELVLSAFSRAQQAEAAFAAGGGALYPRAARERAKNPPLTLGALALSGEALMAQLGLPPGPQVGVLLRQLLDCVLKDPAYNDEARLVALARDMLGARAAC